MKKIINILLITILFIPVMVNAETCENDKVYIDSISIDKNSNVNEIEEATAKGKNINLTLGMSEVGDNIRYKIVVKNDSNEDYILDKNSINISSKYMDYIIESDDNNIVKKKSSKTIYLKVKYSNPVPAESFENGAFNDEINMKVNLSTNENIINPNTGIKYILYISLIVLIMIGMFIIFKKKRLSKLMILIIGLLFIPITTYALCRCDISIRSEVFITDMSFTGTVYRNTREYAVEGYPMNPMMGWSIYNKINKYSIPMFFQREKECNEEIENAISQGFINEDEYYCKKYMYNGLGKYKLNPNELEYNFYIKNEITNGIVTKAQVCFVTDKEVCLESYENSYEANVNILRNEEEWFISNGGNCTFGEQNSNCIINNNLIVEVNEYETYAGLPDGIRCRAGSCPELIT